MLRSTETISFRARATISLLSPVILADSDALRALPLNFNARIRQVLHLRKSCDFGCEHLLHLCSDSISTCRHHW